MTATSSPQSTISAIENGRVHLGVEHAKVLARALKCHPEVLVFPGWEIENQSAATGAIVVGNLSNGDRDGLHSVGGARELKRR